MWGRGVAHVVLRPLVVPDAVEDDIQGAGQNALLGGSSLHRVCLAGTSHAVGEHEAILPVQQLLVLCKPR